MSASPPRPEPLAIGLGLTAFVGLVALNPGGATGDLHRASVVVLAALVALAHAWARWRRTTSPIGSPEHGPAVATLVVVLAAAAQLVPLPAGLVAALAPATAALHAAEAAAAAAGGPAAALAGARPLSIEPAATARAAALGLAYLAMFLAARGVGRDPRAAARVCLGLGALGAAVGLGTLVVQAESPAWAGRAAWPFVNPNHLATFLTLSLGPCLGAALAPLPGGHTQPGLAARALSRRGLAAIAAALIVVGVLATRSRAGAVAAALTAVLAAALAGRLTARSLAGVVVVAAVIAGGLLVVTADVERLADRFDDARARRADDLGGRVENWSVALRVIEGRPWAGAGLATFDDASLGAVDDQRGGRRPGDAHNDYLELVAGVGAPAAALALLLLATGLLSALRRLPALGDLRARAAAGGALAGVLGALAHAWFDFALQLPAVALLFALALGLATGLCAPDPDQAPDERARAGLAGGAPGQRAVRGGPTWRAASLARVALGATLLTLGPLLLLQAAREAAAHAAAARTSDPGLRPEVRAELARRARASLAAADGPLAAAQIAWERAFVEEVAGDAGWLEAATAHARHAVARAPGRATAQAQLAVLLLLRPGTEAEGAARLALAGQLGPTVPGILLTRGEWAVVQLSRTGRAEHARAAVDLLGRALRRDPALRPAIRAVFERRAALLGAQGEALRRELGV